MEAIKNSRIIVLDDDRMVCEALTETIRSWGLIAEGFTKSEVALENIRENKYDIILLDVFISDVCGLDLIPQICNSLKVIIITGLADKDTAIRALKLGAFDLLEKPFQNDLLYHSISTAIAALKTERRSKELMDEIEQNSTELRKAHDGLQSKVAELAEANRVLKDTEKQLRALSLRLLTAHEEERRRIAGELHDSLGSSLSAIKLSLENARDQLQEQKSSAASLDFPILCTQHAMDEARRLMTELRPSMLDDLGLLMTIGWFSRQHRKLHPSIHIEEDIDMEEPDVPEHLKIVIFRIMQEAFHNISKYSRAEFVSLSLAKRNGAIELVIEDNGDGFDVETALQAKDGIRGIGLTSMKERVELSGGSFAIGSVLGEGATIRASWTSAGKEPLSVKKAGLPLMLKIENPGDPISSPKL